MSSQSKSLNCSQVHGLLAAYLEDGLPPEQASTVREHLDTCPACRGVAEANAMLIRQLEREADWRRRRLSPEATMRVQRNAYRRMRRALVMQRITSSTGRVAALVVLVLAIGLFALWRLGLSEREDVGGQKAGIGDQLEVTAITFACMDYQRSQYETLARDFEEANPDLRVQFVSANEASGMQVTQEGNEATTTLDGKEVERITAAADTFVWYAGFSSDDWSFLLDLNPFIDDPSFTSDDFFPGALDHFRWQGGIYGLPASVLPILMLYDPEMFDEAGVPYPHIGWDWDDFVEAAAQLTVREGGVVTRYGFVDTWSHDTVQAMLQQFGVSLWDERTDPPQPLFDTPEVADVLDRYTKLALSYEIMPIPEFGSGVMAAQLVREENVAIWTDVASRLIHNARPTDPKAAPYPEDVNAAHPRSMYGFFISAGTAHPEAAWRWLSYLSANYQPFLEGTMPGRRSVAERMPWWQGLDEETRDVLEYALANPPPPDSPLERPLLRALKAVFEDGVSVEQALAEAQSDALALQASLARTAPAVPRPVATAQPVPATTAAITFAVSDWKMSAYRTLAEKFNESHPEMWVEVIPASFDPAERSAASDCFEGMYPVHSYPEMRQYVRSLEPLIEAHADFELEDFYPQFLAAFQYEGKLWGLPYEADVLMVFYNQEIFAEAGVAPPELDWSMDDLLNTAASLSGDDRYGFATRGGAYEDLLFVLERMGVSLWDDSNMDQSPRPTFDDPSVVAALARYADASRQQPLSPSTPVANTGWPYGTSNAPPAGVDAGRVATWIDWLGIRTRYASSLSFETGVAPLPAPGMGAATTQPTTGFRVEAYAISADAADPQACWEWLVFLSHQPEVVELLPARRSVFASLDWQSRIDETALPAYQAVLEGYEDASPSFYDMRWEPMWLAYTVPWLDEAFQAAVAGADAGQALSQAQRQAEAYVQCLERAGVFGTRETTSTEEEWLATRKTFNACAEEVDPNYPGVGE